MKTDLLYLQHIQEAISKIENYARVGWNEFMTTPHWQDAIIRNLEIIGEATKRLSAQLKSANPDIPWRNIAGLRDVLIHNYMGVDLETVWNVVVNELPTLKQTVARIVRERKGD